LSNQRMLFTSHRNYNRHEGVSWRMWVTDNNNLVYFTLGLFRIRSSRYDAKIRILFCFIK
jgi:hypothetical protein